MNKTPIQDLMKIARTVYVWATPNGTSPDGQYKPTPVTKVLRLLKLGRRVANLKSAHNCLYIQFSA